ncbi:phage tail protein [[Clostridium] scindens]|uniref:phage tail protein n=1 Tax=Clostridium scindens (strain JCM 10418 / VPI 12708) TaxID=29347 RepID=UPI003A933570
MAEEKTNKALDDITGIVDNMGKIVTNANTIFAQLAESLSKTGVSFDTLSSDMAGVMPNILEVITAYDSVKGAVGLVTGGIGKAVETVGKLGQGMSKVPEIFSGNGSKIGPLKDSFSNFASALIIPIEDMIPKLANLAKKIVSTALSMGEKIISFVGGTVTKIVTKVGELGKKLIEKIPTEKIMEKLKEMSGKIGEIWSKTGAKLVGPISDSVSKIMTKFSDMGKNLLSKLPTEEVVNKMKEISGKMKDVWSETGGKLKDVLSEPLKKAGEKVGEVGAKIGEKAGEVGTKIGEKFQTASGKLGEFGSYMGTWGSMVGESFDDVLKKAASFGLGFLKFMGIGAGIGLVVAGLGLLHQAYGDEIDGLLEMMMTKGPEIITNLCNGIVEALPALMEEGALLLNSLMLAITANLPALLAGGFSILSGLIEGIAAQLPMLVPTAITLILTLIQGLLDNIPQLISSGLTLIMGLAEGLINAIPILIAMAPGIIQSLLTGLLTMIPQIILTGIELIGQLALGLVEAIPQIIDAIPQIIDSIKSSFSSVDWGAVGHDIIEGIKNGVGKAADMLLDRVKGVGKKALNAIKDLFKINSPSHVFRDEVGKMMALGMGIGFENNVPLGQMKKGLGQALKTLEGQASVAMSTFGGGISYQNSILSGGSAMQGFDFDEFERRQRKINNERTDRPVFLNGRQVNRALKKGVPVTV